VWAWIIWLSCGALTGFKEFDDETITKLYEKHNGIVSKNAITFILWFVFIVLGVIPLLFIIFIDIRNLFSRKNK
jgi:hypothetical protein